MSTGVERFYGSVKNAAAMSVNDTIDLFIYYLTEEIGDSSASASAINRCFEECSLNVPNRTAPYLSEGARQKVGKFVKVPGGYRLQRHFKDRLKSQLGVESVVKETSAELRKLEGKLSSGPEKDFLSETIDCFEVGAYRAAILMCWLLVMDHVFDLVLKHHLVPFNAALKTVTDKRVKTGEIKCKDDFGDIPEGKFIELLRSSGVISNDVRKILDGKLGIRNSSAHPSGIAIKRSKAIDFIDDLIENILIKFPL